MYILDEANRSALIAQLEKEFRQLEGIQAVIGPDQIEKVGQASPKVEPRCPDLWLAAEYGYAFSETATGNDLVVSRPAVGGTHGYLPDQPDMLALCVIWGPGINPGTDLGKVQIVDIAPTIAAILGIDLPNVDGKPLVTP
ncbi:MAG: hypothetical protein H5U08_18060 [Thermogutta sp.]|nr:hypothetical protein [Thermogutta sp.]